MWCLHKCANSVPTLAHRPCILRSSHGKGPYEEGLVEGFLIKPQEARQLMDEWVPLSRNVSNVRKEEGGLKNTPLACGAVALVDHVAAESIRAQSNGEPPVVWAAFGKLVDLMAQLELDPMRLASCMVNPAGAFDESRFKPKPPGGNAQDGSLLGVESNPQTRGRTGGPFRC